MAEFWSQAAPLLNAATLGGVAWLLKELIGIKTKLAVIETRLEHLESEKRGIH